MAVFELSRARTARDSRRLQGPPTWDDAVRRWRSESTHRAASTIEREERLLTWIAPQLADVPVIQITRGRLADIRSAALSAGWGNRSANYATGLVSTILEAASGWEWVDRVPRLRALQLPPHRSRWLTHDEACRLLAELPPHLSDMASITLETGLRKGSLVAMRWDWIDWTPGRECIRIPAPKMKQRRPLIAPLSRTALEILSRLHAARAGDRVWMHQGIAIREPAAKRWRDALARAGIDDFRWHDLRHTWASWHVQAGTSLAILKELGGWRTMQMVMVYAHLSTGQLFDAVRDLRRP